MNATVEKVLHFIEHTFIEASCEAASDFLTAEFTVDVNTDYNRVERRVVGFYGFVVGIVVGYFDGTDSTFYGIDICLIMAVVVRVGVEYLA